MALDFAISCCSYWILYCSQVELYSDASGLLDLLGKTLCDIENKRLQKILLRAQNFNFNPIHVAGVTNQIADCLRGGVKIEKRKNLGHVPIGEGGGGG